MNVVHNGVRYEVLTKAEVVALCARLLWPVAA